MNPNPNDEYNPFASPVDRNTQSNVNPTVQTGTTLNEYQPFKHDQPAILQTNTSTIDHSAETPKPANNFHTITNDELERRQRELEERAADLARREEAQNRLESQMKGSLKNFPPLPHWFPVQPCFYQDIDVEIPIEYRQHVRLGFYLWLSYALLLFINLFGTMSYMISEGGSQTGTLFGMSLLWFFLFVPASYVCWFRSLYKAFRKDSSFNFFMFFFIFAAQLLVIFIQLLGINTLGSCGWIIALLELKQNVGVGIFMCIIAAAFTAVFVVGIFLLQRVHRVYRSTGASFEKAKAELSRDLASNQNVRSAATGAVIGSMRSGSDTSGRF